MTQTARIVNCFNHGELNLEVSNSTDINHVGGIIGYCYSTISNVYNVGKIKINVTNSSDTYCGGIFGRNIDAEAILRNAYNIGEIENEDDIAIVGELGGKNSVTSTVQNSYYFESNYDAIGEDLSTLTSITKLTEQEGKNSEFVQKLNNIDNIWKEDMNHINNGYPVFNWQ